MADTSTEPGATNKPVSASRSAKMLEKAEENLSNGEYYEALQGYRALYQRYNAQGKKKEAQELVFDGCLKLLQKKEWDCAYDLAMLMVQHLKDNKVPLDMLLVEYLCQIIIMFGGLYRNRSEEPVPDRRGMFVKAVLKWTSMVGDAEGEEDCTYGHPRVHQLMGQLYFSEKNYVKSREHLLYASTPHTFAEMLVELSTTKGYRGEFDLFLAQAVLQLLVLKQREEALRLYKEYTQDHPSFNHRRPPYKSLPLLNFLYYLLLAANKGNSEMFCRLRTEYRHALSRDPCFDEYLDRIGVVLFNMPEPPSSTNGSGGLMGLIDNLMSGISGAHGAAAPDPISMATDPISTATDPVELTPMDTID